MDFLKELENKPSVAEFTTVQSDLKSKPTPDSNHGSCWTDERKALYSETTKRAMQCPERRKRSSIISTAWLADPKNRQKLSECSKKLWQDPEYRKKWKKGRSTCSQTVAAKQRESMVAKYYKDYLKGNYSYPDIADATGLSIDSIGFFVRRFNKQNGYKVITKNRDNQSIDRFVYDSNGKLLQF
jgi:hypothetical protein